MRVPYTNHGDRIVHVGGKQILPGETRDVEASLVQPARPAAPSEAPDPDAPLRQILAHKASDMPEVIRQVPSDSLERLEVLEGDANKPRKGVLEAIEAEKLERASRPDDGSGSELEQFINSLGEMPEDEIRELRPLYAEDEGYESYVQAIDAELEKRAGSGEE